MTITGMRNVGCGAALAVVLVAAAACGGSDDDGSGAEAGATRPEVVMRLVAFDPERLDVAAGRTVTWQNRDVGAHTVTSGVVEQGGAGVTEKPDGRFDSGELEHGDTFEQSFDEPGTYRYFCSLHPATMRGEIRVI